MNRFYKAKISKMVYLLSALHLHKHKDKDIDKYDKDLTNTKRTNEHGEQKPKEILVYDSFIDHRRLLTYGHRSIVFYCIYNNYTLYLGRHCSKKILHN